MAVTETKRQVQTYRERHRHVPLDSIPISDRYGCCFVRSGRPREIFDGCFVFDGWYEPRTSSVHPWVRDASSREAVRHQIDEIFNEGAERLGVSPLPPSP